MDIWLMYLISSDTSTVFIVQNRNRQEHETPGWISLSYHTFSTTTYLKCFEWSTSLEWLAPLLNVIDLSERPELHDPDFGVALPCLESGFNPALHRWKKNEFVNWDYEIPNWMEKQNQWSFQDPKLEVLPYIRPMRGPCKGISTDKMALYGTVPPYLWILRSPLINFMFQTTNQYMSRLGMILSHH